MSISKNEMQVYGLFSIVQFVLYRRMKRVLFFLFFGNSIFFLILIPLFIMMSKTPPQTMFTFPQGTLIDYYQYLSVIGESIRGSWLTSDLFTTEPTTKSIFYLFFILVGKVASLFHFSTITAYQFGRVFSIEFMLITLYVVIRDIVGKKMTLWAAVFGLFSSVPPVFYFPAVSSKLGYIAWWDVLDPLHRLDYIPHHAFGVGLLFLTIHFIIQFEKTKRHWDFVLSFLGAFAVGIFYPPPALIIVFAVPAAVIVYALKQKRPIRILIPYLCIALSGVLSLLLMKYEAIRSVPGPQWGVWEVNAWNAIDNFDRNFLLAGGIALIGSLFAIVKTMTTPSSFAYIFACIWAAAPFILVVFATPLGMGKIRMAYMGQFAAMGALMIIAYQAIIQMIPHARQRICTAIMLLLFLLFSIPSTWYFYALRLQREINTSPHVYIPDAYIRAYTFIDTYVRPYSIVLGDFIVANTLPGFATIRSYYGHWTQTMEYGRKADEVERFYRGDMSPANAAMFVQKNHIDYIIWGPFEKNGRKGFGTYGLPLEQIYVYDDVEIYRVRS